MEYKYRAKITGGLYRVAEGQLAESYNFKTDEWHISDAAIDAFYEGEGTYMIEPSEVMAEIKRQKEMLGM